MQTHKHNRHFSFRKMGLGVAVGAILILFFALNISKVLGFFLVRWEYIIPAIVTIYYLSIQPYLNYADSRTYFFSGAKVTALLALIIILMNIVFELSVYGDLRTVTNFGNALVSFATFVASYALIGGVGHYLFNKNVDPRRKDVYKYQYVGYSLLIGAFTFVITAVVASAMDNTNGSNYYFLLVPVVFASYIAVKLHNFSDKDLVAGTMVGGVTGLMLGLVMAIGTGVILLVFSMTATSVQNLISASEAVQIVVLALPVLVISYAIIGATTGLMMKLFKGWL